MAPYADLGPLGITCQQFVKSKLQKVALLFLTADTAWGNIAQTILPNEKKVHSDIRMPVEYENIASFMEKIDADPVISFDDLEPFEPIEQLDFEVMKYQ